MRTTAEGEEKDEKERRLRETEERVRGRGEGGTHSSAKDRKLSAVTAIDCINAVKKSPAGTLKKRGRGLIK